VGILLTPLAMMLFPELNHRSGSAVQRGRQAALPALTTAAEPALVSLLPNEQWAAKERGARVSDLGKKSVTLFCPEGDE